MTQVRIYRPSKNAMQSGRGATKTWIIEHEPQSSRAPEPLMGWASSCDTLNQIKLKFVSVEDAILYAEKKGWDYTVQEAQEKRVKPRTYLDNFKYKDPKKSA